MPVIIPKKLVQKDDLVVIPRKEYEMLLHFRGSSTKAKVFKTAKPTKEELRIFAQGEKEIKEGGYITLEDLKKKLKLD